MLMDGCSINPEAIRTFQAKKIVNCGGNYSDQLDTMRPASGDDTFTIQPGKGEYVIFQPSTEGVGPKRMVCQVPTKAYAGKIKDLKNMDVLEI